MRIEVLGLTDFRCYRSVEVEFAPALTVVTGANAQGKTSLLEGITWAAAGRSLRGVVDAALVRRGTDQAILRAGIVDGTRRRLLEAEIRREGRNRVRIDRRPLTRTRELVGLLRATVFAPDDLRLVKDGPAARREYLDDLLVSIAPRYDAARGDFERVLRQRNALLRRGVHERVERDTLAVFDEQLVEAGGELVRGRLRLVERLGPAAADAYRALAGDDVVVDARYEAEWAEGVVGPGPGDLDPDAVRELLRAGLEARRGAELDRGVTLVGPHRDEWRLGIGGLDARTHASQGEQRTLALALRLAGHRVCAETVDAEPVLLLDDVFSELDVSRSDALVAHLPPAQTILTSAGVVPPGIRADRWLRVRDGRVEAVS